MENPSSNSKMGGTKKEKSRTAERENVGSISQNTSLISSTRNTNEEDLVDYFETKLRKAKEKILDALCSVQNRKEYTPAGEYTSVQSRTDVAQSVSKENSLVQGNREKGAKGDEKKRRSHFHLSLATTWIRKWNPHSPHEELPSQLQRQRIVKRSMQTWWKRPGLWNYNWSCEKKSGWGHRDMLNTLGIIHT